MKVVNEMKLVFPASPENESLARLVISAFVLPLDPTLEQLADIKTSVSEAVTNAIIHGYNNHRGLIRMSAAICEDGRLSIEILDKGVGIADIAQARQPFFTTRAGDERSGMGFTVMESFMDSVEVRSVPGRGTCVHMEKYLGAQEEFGAQQA